METGLDIGRYVRIVRRRYLYLLVPAVIIALATIATAYVMQPLYEASATILVESQQIPTDLATPTVTADAAERIHVIEQRLLTRDNLLKIAQKFSLYDYAGQNQSPTAIVDSVRGAISIDQIDTVGAARAGVGVIGFTVKYQYRDAGIAAQVANELVNSILSQNVESRLSRATETSSFFEQQKNDLEQKLATLSSKIAEYKRANDGELPETLVDRRSQLAQVQVQIAALDVKIQALSDPSMALSATAPNVAQLTYALQAKQVDLDSFREERTKIAPYVQKGVLPANRLRDLDHQISVAEINLQAIQAQIVAAGGTPDTATAAKALQDQRADLAKQATALSASIAKTPIVAVDLDAMNRDYTNLQAAYQQALSKFQDAKTGERLEQDRQAERFEVIEQATVPDSPKSPDRPKIILAGTLGGIASGIGLLILRQSLDHSIYGPEDVEKLLQLKPMATIPYIATKGQRWRRRWRTLALLLLASFLVAGALYAVDRYYMPLDVVTLKISDSLHNWLAQHGLTR